MGLREHVGVLFGVLLLAALLTVVWRFCAWEFPTRVTPTVSLVTLSDLEVLQRQMDSLRGIVHDLAKRDITPVNITAKSVTVFNSNGTLSVQVKEEEEEKKSGVSTMQVPLGRKVGK